MLDLVSTLHRAVPAVLCVALLLGATACTDLRRAVGWEKTAPDEFAVVSRAPLSLPPEFGLRPPDPGAPRPQEPSTRLQAERTLAGTTGFAGGPGQTPGEAALLGRAGALGADPGIRRQVDRESDLLAEADRSLIDRLIFWQRQPPPGTVVDPRREAERLRENQALGRPVTAGDVPVIERRRRAPLEGLF